jgi:hypothetical protein
MNESISFYLASGERHPDEKKLRQSAFAQLISEQLQKYDEAFGPNRTVEFRLSADDENGMLKLAVIDTPWFHVFDAKVSLEALTVPILPEKFKQDIAFWFSRAAEPMVSTRKIWGAEK